MSNVTHLGAVRSADDNSKWTPEEMLRALADEIAADGDVESAMVIVRRKGGAAEYDSGSWLCNLHFSQAVALLEITKATLLRTLTGDD